MTGTILVGVDGSASSLDAVDLAAHEAAWHGLPLHIVHAFPWPLLRAPVGPSELGPPEGGLRHDAERIVSAAADRAKSTLKSISSAAQETSMSAEVIDGFPTATLLAEASDSSMIVVGDRGLGGFTGLMIGSVALQLATHASRPVMIQRGRDAPTGPVVVGVDGSAANAAAVEFAFAEAAARHADLVAVHVWSAPKLYGPSEILPLVYNADILTSQPRRLLSQATEVGRSRHPEVNVSERLTRGRARRRLIEATLDAALIVVGTRGRGAAKGLILGSVSQSVLYHSSCPVAIVSDAGR